MEFESEAGAQGASTLRDEEPSADDRSTGRPPSQTSPEERFRQHLAIVSHELRTPATVIGGLAAMLAQRRASFTEEGLEEALQSLHRQADRMMRLLTNLLDMTNVESGELEVRAEPVRVRGVVDSALASAAPPQAVSVAVDVEGDPEVVADSDRLEQVLVNLLINAYRYGGSTVQLRVREGREGVELAVVDAGPGVPFHEVPRLFDAFARGAHAHEGSGLGLYIARGLVDAMGGQIRYESGEPTGARFVLTLPRSVEAVSPPIPIPPEPAEGTEPSPKPRILVVDDERDTLFLLTAILQSEGYDVVSAWNGQEALDRLAEADVDAVLTDQMMPVMDGRELIARVRSDRHTATVPIGVVSAAPTANSGADAVLRKPFRPDQIVDLVRRLLEGRR